MKLFTPPGAPSWLDPLLRRIRQGLAEPWESPLRLQSIVTANLPPAADWEGGIVYDDTTSTAKISDGATWAAIGGGGGAAPTLNEIPTGLINGANVTYTLAATPSAAGIALYLNGLRQTVTTDYSLSGATITMVTAPATGDALFADYFT